MLKKTTGHRISDLPLWKYLLVATAILAIGCRKVSPVKTEKPNILFLFTDDQRYGTLGALGMDEVLTPGLDGLIATGTTFTNAYILGAPHGAVCSPSRAMLMTGRHYFNIEPNVYAQFSVPDSLRGKSDKLTFPEYFRSNGYATFATGKQHNGKDWVERGFEKGKSIYLGGMTKHFGTNVKDFDTSSGWSQPYADKEKFSSELFADAAIDYLENREKDNPFLMYVSFTAPHDPRTAPQEFHDLYPPEKIKLPKNFMDGHPFPIADMKIRDEKLAAFPRTEKEIKQHISDYYAMISATDAQIVRVLEALEKSGEAENTIIVFSGDNGLAVGQHGLLGKQSVYEHSVKVPLIFSGPGIPKNEKKAAFAYLHDVFPTLCGLTDLAIPASVETKDLTPVILGQQEAVREVMHFAYNAWPGDKKPKERGAHRAVRKGDYKLIVSSKDGMLTEQLFNLKNDPWEMSNLLGDKEVNGIYEDLKLSLKSLIKETGDTADLNKDMFGLYEGVVTNK
ncbi:sulfatase-like hydrolase/transferase [Arenibacter sp. F26102]|uniref:sulfatase-like hydrolase/transferase n=1 Tax=Arenibacter sp. F26102 TaxID=2926416 RepID=UPI001FF1CC49|nr:sulfatase-like hydrolase/transferase [Arenibacter sp. F26102]MCK0146210.1 sulfatase-like hydrolase/transferase [Arenibacter sp. F26102]